MCIRDSYWPVQIHFREAEWSCEKAATECDSKTDRAKAGEPFLARIGPMRPGLTSTTWHSGIKIYFLSNENIFTLWKYSIEWQYILSNENIISNENYFYWIKTFFLCQMKIYFIEWKYIFYRMKIYFYRIRIFLSNENIFFSNENNFYRMQIYFYRMKIIFIEFCYISATILVVVWRRLLHFGTVWCSLM